ncbi:PAS domain S-box protein [Leptolyngbya sp. FACHB-8]|uniref:PAS domain S-box protein n=1 Tax=unclassified Leptolyngbya TaxID=2650499 RepID=UPI001689F16A|nr:PAS domain S-box protein [Leptolyngbya sp. FACHB-8]MBD1909318.1 PAS domain S-box protein [Leptolyngbya sp. FACHB-8]
MGIPPVVLMVDDSIERRAHVRSFLDQEIQQAYIFLESDNGVAGLNLCQYLALLSQQRSLPNVILLHNPLPDMDGLEFLRRLAQQAGQYQLPVIVLTDVEEVAVAVEAIKLGGQNYFGWNNLTAASLGAAVQSVLGGQSPREPQNQTQDSRRSPYPSQNSQAETPMQPEDRLNHNYDLASAVLEAVNSLIIVLDRKGRILRFNRACERLTGYSFAEMQHQGLQKLLLPEEQDAVQETFQTLTAGHFPNQYENYWVAKDGSRHLIAWSNSALVDDQGQVEYVIGTGVDITDQRQMEADLRLSEAQRQLAIDVTHIATWDWRIKRNVIEWNDNHFRLLGLVPGEVTPSYEAWRDRVHPEDVEQVEQSITRALSTQADYTIEYRVVHPDGTVHWVSAQGRALYDDSGQPFRMLGIMLDVSDRKQAEQDLHQLNQELERRVAQRTTALQTSEARYRAIIEDQTELIVRFSPDGIVRFVNDAYCRYFGLQSDDLLGNSYDPVIYEADRELVSHQIQAISPENPTVTLENRVVVQGEIRWTQWITRLLFDAQGQASEFQAVGRDITNLKRTEEALRISEERLKLALEGSGDGLWDWDIVTDETHLSPNWLGMLGYQVDELPAGQEMWLQLIHPEDSPWVVERLNAHFADSNVPYAFDYRMRMKSGEWKWIANYGKVVARDEQGAPLRMVGTHQDISDRKQAEEQLRNLSVRLTLALQSGAIGTWDWDLIQEAYWDDAMYALYGFDRAVRPAVYQDWLNALHPEDREPSQAALQSALQGERDFNIEFRIYRTDGSLRYIKAAAVVQRDDQGNPRRMVGINYDITERKQAEEALATYTREVEDLYNNAPCGYHSLDAEGRYIRVNQTELDILGYTCEEMLGRPVTDFLTESSQQTFQQNFLDFLQRGWARNLEYEFVCKDGTVLPVLINATAVTAPDGTHLYNRATLLDIRDRKQAEEQLRISSERISLANAELARATRIKDEFLAGMSHELRTPLNAVMGLSEALLEEVYGPLNENQRNSLRVIEQSGQHLLSLINDILDLSKIESGRMDLEIEAIAVSSLCEESLSFVRQQANQKHLRLSLNISEGLVQMQCDARRIRQALINLLSNAVKFTPNHGAVTLQVSADSLQETINFSVIDTGIGIAPEQFSKLFQPFVQLDSSLSRRYEGTGLGLALVRRIVELHGGSISLESEVGSGSRFTITLPWVPQTSVLPTERLDLRTTPLPLLQQALVVEDSQDAANQIVRYLAEMEAETVVHPQGEGVLDIALETQPDLIILDILLPDQSGWDVLIALKANPATASIPVMIISVLDERTYGLELGAAEYLVKPITRQQLQGAMGQILESRNALEKQTTLVITPNQSTRSPLILLAEDQEDNIVTTLPYLQLHGFEVILARNGLEALDLAEQHHPDLILMDIQMPEMDGLEATRHIRANVTLSRVPILALTALAMPGDRERCLAAGANEYLTKPVGLKQLLKVIATYVPAPRIPD